MHLTITIALLGLGALALLKVASVLVTASSRRSKAKQLGCEPPVLVPGGGFLGLNHLRRFLDADSKGLFADLFLRRHEEMAATFGRIVPTFRFQILGAEIVHTSDSKNIQALLATQFNDFDLGSRRRGNMGAMLGDGIVSSSPRPYPSNFPALTTIQVCPRWQIMGTLPCYAQSMNMLVMPLLLTTSLTALVAQLCA